LNAEVITPFPGAGNDRTLRMFGFFDVGNVFGETEPLDPWSTSFAASVGIGVSWISPLARCAWPLPTRCASSLAIESRNCNSRLERLSNEVFFTVNAGSALAMGLLSLASNAQAQDFRVGFVNTDRIFREANTPRRRRPSSSRSSRAARRN
jgi:hypothetical protein